MGYNIYMAKKIIIAVLAILLIGFVTYYNATKINTEQLVVREEKLFSDKIDNDTDGLVLAYYSDVCYGQFIDEAFLSKTIDTINMFQPDLIIFGGDLFDIETIHTVSSNDISKVTELLSKLSSKYGKYYVYGDFDHQSDETINSIMFNSGFESISNTNKLIAIDSDSYLNLIGIDSLVGGNPDIAASFSSLNPSSYSIVTSHCPDIFDSLQSSSFDYLLSAHSRGGQVYLPLINFFIREEGCKKYYRGKFSKNNHTLDISNGVGRSSSNARLWADAEIVIYTLKSKNH